ncbi:sodium:proton antiporter [Rickettsiales bacterium]|nr:sodium:proton antiporter [Rickettsiales bacterium]
MVKTSKNSIILLPIDIELARDLVYACSYYYSRLLLFILQMIFKTSVVLFAVWLIYLGHISTFSLLSGAVSVIFIILFVRYLAKSLELLCAFTIFPTIKLSWRFPVYFLWLIWQIALSSFAVARIVWQLKPSISPIVLSIKSGQKTDFDAALLANSITLTPGTVSVFQQDMTLYVHALTAQNGADITKGVMTQQVLGAVK